MSQLPATPALRETLPTSSLALLFGSITLLGVLAQVLDSGFTSVLALCYFIALAGVIAQYSPSAFILLLWFVFIRFTTMVSGIAIETGGYMPEILMDGYPTGGFVRLALFYTFGMVGAVYLINRMLPKLPRQTSPAAQGDRRWAFGVFGLVILLCLWAVFIGLKNGFPLLTNVDRIVYWNQVSSRFLFFFLGNRPILAALLGLIYATSTGNIRKSSLGLLVIVLIISFLFAEKFTSITQILIFFITPIFLLNHELLRNTAKRMLPFGGLLAVITMPAVLVVYGVFEDPASAVERLQIRATSQAQIWFVADLHNSRLLSPDTELVAYNLKSLVSTDADEMSRSSPFLGARDFMSDYLDNVRYRGYVERGVTLTMATEGYLLKVFGWFCAIPAYLFIVAVYVLQLLYFAFAVYQYSPVRIVIASKLLIWSNFGLNQGYFWNIVGAPILALMFVIMVAEILVARNRPTPAKLTPPPSK